MTHDLGLLTRLATEGDDGEPVPLVRSTADLTTATIAAYVRAMPDELSRTPSGAGCDR